MKNVELSRKICWSLSILATAVCTLFPARTFGQSSNRWLLVLETTSSMRQRTNGTLAEVQDLLMTGMHGLIHTGDTIGIWTFNDRLHTGEAPLQRWSPESFPSITRNTLQFLVAQPYAKSARMDEMLTNMLNVVDSSPFITVILFTDGDDSIKGTPFDAQINQVYKSSYRKQKKASMPFVTVLRGVDGEITTNTVNMAPWPAEIPSVPPPPVPLKPRAAAPKPEPPTTPPLIFIGKKPEPAPPASESESNAAPAAPSNSTEPNTVGPKAEAPAEPNASAPASPAVSVATPAVEPLPATSAAPAEAPQAIQVAEVPPGAPATQPAQSSAAPAAPPSVAAQKSETHPSRPNTSNAPSAAPADMATAAGALQDNLFTGRNIAIVSVAFTVIVCGLLVMSARRARTSQASLITRSLDRERR